MKKHLTSFLLSLFFLISCAPKTPSPLPAPIFPATEIVESAPAPTEENDTEIRYALLAPSTEENIWSLFDENGASYENYATQGKYFPHLYYLAPPNNELTPLLADGFPTLFTQEGAYFVSQIALLPNLKWDDGSSLTAEDIAFTINTALEFQLGLNWAEFYDPEKLHHAEALDSQTIKYYFSSHPSAGDWQHGALIGIFASRNYWQSKIVVAQSLLPPADIDTRAAEYQLTLQKRLAEEQDLRNHIRTLKETSAEYRGQILLLDANLAEQKGLQNNLELTQREKRERFAAARAALYALPPTEKMPTENYPVYQRDAALRALLEDEIDFILSPNGLSLAEIEQLSNYPNIHFTENRRNDIRFLAFNHRQNLWDDVALRRAISCLIDPENLANEKLDERVVPALGWVAAENIGWHTSIISPPCAGMDADARLAAGTRTLQKAGYLWEQAPSPKHAGRGILLPSGEAFPPITLLAPREDLSRIEAASYIANAAQMLGIPLKEKILPADDLFYAVYGIGDYDLAIVGWRLSIYPDYLCDFFSRENSYGYYNTAINEKCAEFSKISDPILAREKLFEIEILLWDDLPAVPLFSSKITEAYRNFTLPFENHLGGFAPVLYGVPE